MSVLLGIINAAGFPIGYLVIILLVINNDECNRHRWLYTA